jgi:hypothetical protein
MESAGERELLAAAEAALSGAERALMGEILAFVAQRLESARVQRTRIGGALACSAQTETLQEHVHGFLRECWDALDGLGRLVSLCLYGLFPSAGLHAPKRITRQCTFYTVRRSLRNDPAAAAHPLSVLLWDETRRTPAAAYVRLSFLYNISLFVPVPLRGGRLPGSADLAEHVRCLIRPQHVEGCPVEAGLNGILEWLSAFTGRCYQRMAAALSEARRD